MLTDTNELGISVEELDILLTRVGADGEIKENVLASYRQLREEIKKVKKAQKEAGGSGGVDDKPKLSKDVLAQSKLNRLKSISKTELLKLGQIYQQGEIAMVDYFARRKKLINNQAGAEIAELNRLAAAEQDQDKRLKLEDKVFARRQQHYRDLINLRKEFLDKERSFAVDEAKSQTNRINQMTQTALASLSSSYAKGETTLADYFEKRRTLIENQYRYEIDKLTELAAAETDLSKKRQYTDEIFRLEQELERKIIKLEDDKLAKEEEVAAKRKAADDMLADMRTRNAQKTQSALGVIFNQELAALDERHREEKERLEELTKNYESELEKRAALKEAADLQKMEKERLMADQEKRLAEYRLGVAADLAGSMSDIFQNLYEATGENNKELFYLAKTAAIAEATIAAFVAANNAWKTGGILGKVQAAITLAGAMANVAKIKAQTLATGGPVLGYSPNDKADNVPIWATAGEFMQPVASVKYYGREVMEAIRRRLIPKDFFKGFSLPSLPSPSSFALAEGGAVPAGGANSYSVTVPVSVSGGDESLARTLKAEIENTVVQVMRRELR